MASVEIQAPPELAEYLARVRSDTDALTWAVFAYKEGSGNALELAGSGQGGLDEFRAAFDEGRRMYGMCRLLDYYDGHQTVKFVFVVWAGARVGVIKKARMATHKGSIQVLMGQAHLTIDASEAADLADDVVMTRITDASGSGSRVLPAGAPARGGSVPPSAPSSSAAAVPSASAPAAVAAPAAAAETAAPARARGEPQAGAGGAKSVPAVPRGGGELQVLDREEAAAAIGCVRNDADATDWMLLSYEGASNQLRLAGSGSGGVEALKEHLAADNASYGIVRVNDVFDGHTTVKFVLILWLGEKVRVVRKAKIATHKGQVVEFVGQYHTDVAASSLDELTHEAIMGKVMDASGSAVRTLEVGAKPRGAPKTRENASTGSAGKAPSVARSAGGELNLVDPEQMQAAIQCVRNDNDSADWVLVGYEGQTNNIGLINVGEGGVEELKQNLTDDNVCYGIVRVTDQIDGHVTVKFVLIIWIGERVKIMRKAKTATHKGEVLKVIGQYHTDVVASTKDELTFEEIMRKVKDASGTAVHVC